ncbi:MAG: DUF885 domain-containing protein [Balneolaceae bacterium]|nr:DUF885 domain-containing protein [Balneolaceae bacterium]
MKSIFLLLFSLLWIQSQAQVLTSDSTLNSVLRDIDTFYDQRYSEEERERFPLGFANEAHFREEYEFNKALLERLDQMDINTLSFDDYISHSLLRFDIHNQVQLFEFKEYLIPILSESGFHTRVLWRTNRSINSQESLERYIAYLNDIPRYFEENIELMRTGIDLGITQPLEGLQNYGATYDPYIVDDPMESIFFRPMNDKPESFSQADWEIALQSVSDAINLSVTPAYRNLKLFFENEYFPNTRDGLGAATMPNGKAYYEHKTRYYTTQDLTPEAVHEIGLEEVQRIRTEMESIIADLNFEGSFADFIQFLRTDAQFYPATGKELLKEAAWIAKSVDGRLPSLFGKLPRQPYGVVPVPDYLAENYTAGRYSGAPLDSDRGGQYWVNTTKLESRTMYTLEALTLHEAMPGHHLQIALTAELEDLPSFRRNMYINAFGEGWGLYAEYLGYELDLYQDPYSEFGRLTYEMWRACRLVIDTGVHYMGWTRDEAVAFLGDNSALSIHEVNTEINRYITWPGQALAYKMGEITIKNLREKAEAELGENFDIKEFHDVILSKGTVTMQILEEIVDHYIKIKLSN